MMNGHHLEIKEPEDEYLPEPYVEPYPGWLVALFWAFVIVGCFAAWWMVIRIFV